MLKRKQKRKKKDIIEKKQEKTLEDNKDITEKVVNNVEMKKIKHKEKIEDVTTKLEKSPKSGNEFVLYN